MKQNLQIDSLDKRILNLLIKNARIPFIEIARICKVSGAAIHQRIQKLRDDNIIKGSQYILNSKNIGFTTCAFIGLQINLISTRTHSDVFNMIKEIPEIVECYHITGKFSLFVKVFAHDNEHLKKIIVEKIQSIAEISSTETFISLEEGFIRQIPIE